MSKTKINVIDCGTCFFSYLCETQIIDEDEIYSGYLTGEY